MLVLDASLVVELSIDRLGEDIHSALRDKELVGPPLLWSEVPSVLHEMAFRGDISRALARTGVERFLSGTLEIEEQRPPRLRYEAWELADSFGWAKTYDAEYLALATLLECRLVTIDAPLHRRTNHLGFVVTPNELLNDPE